VKADDVGVAMAASTRPQALAPLTRAIGRGLVKGMPILLKVLAIVGTAAMVWVGGGIIVHGLEGYGFAWLGHAIHDVAAAAGHAVPALGGLVEWLVSAAAAGLVGLVLGGLLIPLIHYVAVPLLKALRGGSRRTEKHSA
jgi:predicted DNA repair protein MutK